MGLWDTISHLPFLLALFLFPIIRLSQLANVSPEKHTISGEVVDSMTGQPIAGALVQIGGDYAALTDREGKFDFAQVSNSLSAVAVAQKPGYFSPHSGADWVTGESHSLSLKLVPEAVLTGTALDQNGQPLQGLPVQLKMLQIRNGLSHWLSVQSTRTSVEGEFRFAELQAGKYSLSTDFQVDGSPDAASSVAFVPVVYPPLGGDGEAALTLAPGDHIEANLNPPVEKLYQVNGHIDGPHSGAVNFEAEKSSGGQISPVVRFNEMTGDFRLLLPSGSYGLKAHAYIDNVQFFGTREISVSRAPLRGISISLAPLAAIPVEIEYQTIATSTQNAPAAPPEYSNVLLADANPQGSAQSFSIMPASPNSSPLAPLSIPNLEPGRYQLQVSPPAPWYLASATCGGLDLTRELLAIAGSAAGCTIHAVLRNDSAALSWSIQAKGQAGQPGVAFVYAMPLDNRNQSIPISVAQLQRSEFAAQGVFEGLAPGRYLVIALSHEQDLAYAEGDVVQRYLPLGQEITVTANGKPEVQLDVVSEEP